MFSVSLHTEGPCFKHANGCISLFFELDKLFISPSQLISKIKLDPKRWKWLSEIGRFIIAFNLPLSESMIASQRKLSLSCCFIMSLEAKYAVVKISSPRQQVTSCHLNTELNRHTILSFFPNFSIFEEKFNTALKTE